MASRAQDVDYTEVSLTIVLVLMMPLTELTLFLSFFLQVGNLYVAEMSVWEVL